jgi:hypothetical protein
MSQTTESIHDTVVHSDTLVSYFAKAISDKEIEIEWIYGTHPKIDTLQKQDFIRLLCYLRTNHPLISETNSLDINRQYTNRRGKTGIGNIRCTIEGVQDIRSYCKTNSIEGIPNLQFIKKQIYKDHKNLTHSYDPIINRDYNYRINAKQEQPLSDEDNEVIEFRRDLKDSLKSYRYKKRYSFATKDGLFRIDLTAVKQCPYDIRLRQTKVYRSFVDASILKMPESYEVEIEYIGSSETQGGYPIESFIQHVLSGKSVRDVSGPTSSLSFNVFSELAFIEKIQRYDAPSHSWGEFQSESSVLEAYANRLFPPSFTPVSLNPEDDIHYTYWDTSDQEYLLDLIMDTHRSLYYERIETNTKADYKGAKQTDYAVFSIVPSFQEEDIPYDKQSLPTEIMVPLIEISETSESVKLTEPITVELQEGLARYSDRLMNSEEQIADQTELTTDSEPQIKHAKQVVKAVIQRFSENAVSLLKVIRQTDRLISKSTEARVLEGYHKLTQQGKGRTRFVGPNPVPISLKELDPENPHTILHSYMVTEKADGIRAQLYKRDDGTSYLLTQKLKVMETGVTFGDSLKGEWLLDGEYITQNKHNEPIERFMVFDVYYAGEGKDSMYPSPAYTYPWKSSSVSRSSILAEFQANFDATPLGDSSVEIGYKRYYEGPKALKQKKDTTQYTNLSDMGKVCRKILNRDKDTHDGFGYTIDGLIFLPMNYPVSSKSESSVSSINGPWAVNYKWKSALENTIDFRVQFVKETVDGKQRDKLVTMEIDGQITLCRQVSLVVKYDMKRDPDYDYASLIVSGDSKKAPEEIPFSPPDESKDIHYCNLPLVENKTLCTRDKVELTDGMIVEMRYCPHLPVGAQWEPLRHRWDKQVPQLFIHANQIWDTIQHPVTEDMIRGDPSELSRIPEYLEEHPVRDTSDTYYLGDDNRFDSPDRSLRVFHNYVKQKLISAITSVGDKSIAIMDTSIGRGGDLNKYLRSSNNISFLFALDISSDVNRAAKRFYLERMRKPRAMFVQYDTSISIKEGTGVLGSEKSKKQNTHYLDILYGRDRQIPKEMRPILPRFKNLGQRGFNVISSQFSFHYYLKDEETFRGYLQNLSDNCKTHGYFIGTCYDGMKVFQSLQQTSDGLLEMNDEYGNRVYSIQKRYEIDDFTYTPDRKSEMFGQKIDVYMNSIGQTITEYLVNFNMVADIMKEYHFRLATPKLSGKYSGIFDNTSYSYMPGMGGFESILQHLQNRSTSDSDLQNFYPEALEIFKEENQPLIQLSSLNNWFIFEKYA